MTETTDHLPAGLSEDLGWLLGQAVHSYALTIQRTLGEFPGGGRGYLLLRGAVNSCARNQIELARQLGVDRTVMVYLVDDLVKAGLVERRPDPADRRNRLVVPTAAGETRLAEASAAIERVEELILGPLDDDEREEFRETLRRLARHHQTLAYSTDQSGTVCQIAGDDAAAC